MSETVIERHYRDRVQSVRQLAAHEENRVAPIGQELEDLVTLCADLSLSGRELMEKEYRRLFKESNVTVAWLRERRRVMEELSASYLQLAESVRASAHKSQQEVGGPSGKEFVARLDDAITALSHARQSLLDRWPVGSDEDIAQGQASAARGEGLDVDEAFAQIIGTDVESWRRRVEDHKGRRQA